MLIPENLEPSGKNNGVTAESGVDAESNVEVAVVATGLIVAAGVACTGWAVGHEICVSVMYPCELNVVVVVMVGTNVLSGCHLGSLTVSVTVVVAPKKGLLVVVLMCVTVRTAGKMVILSVVRSNQVSVTGGFLTVSVYLSVLVTVSAGNFTVIVTVEVFIGGVTVVFSVTASGGSLTVTVSLTVVGNDFTVVVSVIVLAAAISVAVSITVVARNVSELGSTTIRARSFLVLLSLTVADGSATVSVRASVILVFGRSLAILVLAALSSDRVLSFSIVRILGILTSLRGMSVSVFGEDKSVSFGL